MSGHMKVQKVMVQPINLMFKHFQNRTKVVIWLFDRPQEFIEGLISGFDEFMNIVMDEAHKINKATNSRQSLGRILLKGENISLIQTAPTTS
ncbi:hypothetical protein DSO57_1008459 [Entomophthora muscae]|uniref:Uncharacterized protein n=2 Tax=Entomophthora muscae TaxID=34485 RepID=A0ACC2U4T6_9FUNG|nr:hypothetical protein DSO57_1012857 [Entomophthora muscae]KAJ9082028.1 hypothetical protein DSO57_1008459 [Entomophthora muscae]